MNLNIFQTFFSRGALDEDFHRTGEITLCHPLQDFPYQDQVLVKCQGEEGRHLRIEVVLHPRDDGHNHRLCQTNNQQHALRGGYLAYDQAQLILSMKVGGSMGLWLGLGVVQAFQLFTKYLLPLLCRQKHEKSVKIAS